MTSPDLEIEFSDAAPVRDSSPVAFVSRSALLHNARDARARGARTFSQRVLAGDAWGHGIDLVRSTLESVGIVTGTDDLDPEHLFGVSGSGGVPAMALVGTVLSVKRLRAGEGVSYGYLHRAPTDTRIALVTGGYAQGVVRSLGGKISVAHAEGQLPVIGRVAMDVCVVDVGDSGVMRGDNVLFFGRSEQGAPPVREWARESGLSIAEITTMVGLRAVRRVAE
ncbi:alanine racemase [Microbacterium sp. C7(2022)]|uniref:alanine racemase n=1 Tax=Microbacterium sp. C7(2022) TaxID=2992759 RepID=UPI00237B4607|nr:alanine racemase C-terminal domain-containing protein [Microbacterium sp. C7(2022)]MDE0545464.1 alanine racemase [Microbacterium sp. C7(2022)]